MSDIQQEVEVDTDGKVALGTLYDLNKEAYKAMLPYNDETLHNKLSDIAEWFKDKQYCMLLCKERSDYTVFNFVKPNYSQAAQTNLRRCFKWRGKVLDIRFDDTANAWAIWLKDKDEVFMYYLFECRDFIVEVGVD